MVEITSAPSQSLEFPQVPSWQTPSRQPLDNAGVVRFSSLFHGIVSTLWDDQTAHPEYRPLPDDMPDSYGQCVPVSCLLFEELTRKFPQEKFNLVSGLVYTLGKTALDKAVLMPAEGAHVWLGWQHYNLGI